MYHGKWTINNDDDDEHIFEELKMVQILKVTFLGLKVNLQQQHAFQDPKIKAVSRLGCMSHIKFFYH